MLFTKTNNISAIGLFKKHISFVYWYPIGSSQSFSSSTLLSNEFNNIIPDSYSEMLINPLIKVKKEDSSSNNSLDLNSGEFKYLHNVQLPNNVNWVGGDFIFKDLGSITGSREQLNYDTIINNLRFILNNLNKSQSYSILFMVQSGKNHFSLDRQYLINFDSNIDNIIDSVTERMEILSLKYGVSLDDRLGCKYRPLSLKVKNPSFDYHIKPVTVKDQTQVNFMPKKLFSNKFLPNSMDLRYYGALLKVFDDKRNFLYIYNSNTQLLVTLLEPGTYHKVDVLSKDGSKLLFTYVDERFDGYFIRVILNKEIKHPLYFKYDFDFNQLSMEFEHDFPFMTRTKREMVQNKKIITFDIETYLDESKNSIPYSCGFYDGNNYYSYYLSDFLSSESMLLKCIADMMDPKYKGYTVYVHNFANFDSIFLYKLLYTQYKVKFLSKDQNFISLTISSLPSTAKKSRSNIVFRDSAKLLLGSLKGLGKSFDVPVTKGIFPYSFVNAHNLNYVGSIPSFNFYNQDNDTRVVYSEISKNCTSWSLRLETIDYLEKDLISLFQIIVKMSDGIYSKYRLNITSFATLSGLALAIFRSNFMKDDDKIVMLKGKVDHAVREAYYGGATDVINPSGENLYYYDANSLYPAAMLMPMPVGQPTYSTNKNLNELFGFVRATVTTPCSNIPILPMKKFGRSGGDAAGLIFPNGTWTAWFFSEELKDAVNIYGYKATIHESYLFERSYDLFKGYVDTMGSIKQSSTGATRQIHKLLMNSLYGRMGMNNEPEIISVLDSDSAQRLHLTHQVIENFQLLDNLEFIRCSALPVKELCEQSGINYFELSFSTDHSSKQVISSSPLAAATTAYGRMLMNKLKFLPNNKFYYGDTDSAILEKPLNPKMIGNNIGEFKLEYPKIVRGLFIAPKLYFLELEDGKIISKGKGYSGKLGLLDYIKLYDGHSIEVIDKRWIKNLKLSTLNISDRTIRISSKFSKRNKLYSLGKWVATSPLCVNPDGSISPLDLVIYSGPPLTMFQRIELFNSIYFKSPYLLLPPPSSNKVSHNKITNVHPPSLKLLPYPPSLKLLSPPPSLKLLSSPTSNYEYLFVPTQDELLALIKARKLINPFEFINRRIKEITDQINDPPTTQPLRIDYEIKIHSPPKSHTRALQLHLIKALKSVYIKYKNKNKVKNNGLETFIIIIFISYFLYFSPDVLEFNLLGSFNFDSSQPDSNEGITPKDMDLTGQANETNNEIDHFHNAFNGLIDNNLEFVNNITNILDSTQLREMTKTDFHYEPSPNVIEFLAELETDVKIHENRQAQMNNHSLPLETPQIKEQSSTLCVEGSIAYMLSKNILFTSTFISATMLTFSFFINIIKN